LLVAKRLSGLIKLLYGFIIVPKFIRDFVYNVIAKNRYKWFGKKEACWIPTPELKELFLDTDNLVQP
jgi:predicted DCC family thiol-disulfide oxidoreductase YuxK